MQENSSSHLQHLKQILTNILKKSHQRSKSETILFSTRAKVCIYSILNEVQIFKCGYRKVIQAKELVFNPYLKYKEIVVAMSATQQCIQQISQCSSRLKDIHILNITISTPENKEYLRQSTIKQCPVKGLIEQNLDFTYLLDNVYRLGTTPVKNPGNSETIDRLVSLLCSQQKFNEFQIHYPQESANFGNSLKQKLQSKLQTLQKYEYKSYKTASPKTKLIIFQRNEDLSPFVYSLYYGSLIEQLKLANTCNILSGHSKMYNKLYFMDVLEASQSIQKQSEELSGVRKMKINTNNFEQTKKVLLLNYNPEMTKQQINFHYEAMDTMNNFVKKKADLICLQQSIANGITEQGQKMKGSKVVKSIYKWSQNQSSSYEEYLALVMMSLKTNSFWWFQKSQLKAALKEKDRESVKEFEKMAKGKQRNIQEKGVNKDEERLDLFRHQPNLVRQFQAWLKNPKDSHEILEVNKVLKPKSSRTIIYINSVVGYNELIMLKRAMEDKQIKIVCKNLMTTKEWTQFSLK